jgi:hypothetical protein
MKWAIASGAAFLALLVSGLAIAFSLNGGAKNVGDVGTTVSTETSLVKPAVRMGTARQSTSAGPVSALCGDDSDPTGQDASAPCTNLGGDSNANDRQAGDDRSDEGGDNQAGDNVRGGP